MIIVISDVCRQCVRSKQICKHQLPPPLLALQVDPWKCTVVGHGLELVETGQQAHFEVHLADMAGDPYTTEHQVTAELRSLMDSSVTPASVAHKTPDIFNEVSYQPNTRGQHELSVVVNDEPVQGSPFLVSSGKLLIYWAGQSESLKI